MSNKQEVVTQAEAERIAKANGLKVSKIEGAWDGVQRMYFFGEGTVLGTHCEAHVDISSAGDVTCFVGLYSRRLIASAGDTEEQSLELAVKNAITRMARLRETQQSSRQAVASS